MGNKYPDGLFEQIYSRKTIRVHCDNCGLVDEDTTEFLNIEENIFGEDVLTFKCKCGKKNRSRRYG